MFPAYAVTLTTLTHLPRLDLAGPRQSDKLGHVLAFGLLAFFFWRFIATFRNPLPGHFAWTSSAFLLVWAAFDEWTQPWVGRSADLYDWLADAAGIVAVSAVLEWRRRSGRGPGGVAR